MKGDIRSVEIAFSGVAAPGWKRRIAPFCRKALRAAGYAAWDISLLLCDDTRMKELNARYRGKDRTTDVLSFPRGEGTVAGDIAISLPAMRRNAASFDASENDEMKRLLIHGILHVAGMDHGKGSSGPMLDLQESLIERLRAELVVTE